MSLLSSEQLAFLAGIVRAELGIVYSEANHYQLEKRVIELAKHFKLEGPLEFYHLAKLGLSPAMKVTFLDHATNNETLFFRDQVVFDAYRQLLSEWMTAGKAKIRIWSAACSYGQEVYSLAMATEEGAMGKLDYRITATDISSRALAAAKEGVYSSLQVNRGLSSTHLSRWFDKVPGNEEVWKVKETLRSHVEWKRLNLIEPFGSLGPFELIFCRNVLIYQNVEHKREILARLFDKLTPGGLLVLGAAESLIGLHDGFETKKIGAANFYQKPSTLSAA